MKVTLLSLSYAFAATRRISNATRDAEMLITAAATAVECTSPQAAKKFSNKARNTLVRLRRTQTAALAQIDDAIKSIT